MKSRVNTLMARLCLDPSLDRKGDALAELVADAGLDPRDLRDALDVVARRIPGTASKKAANVAAHETRNAQRHLQAVAGKAVKRSSHEVRNQERQRIAIEGRARRQARHAATSGRNKAAAAA